MPARAVGHDGFLSQWRRRSAEILSVAAVVSVAFLVWILFNAPLFQQRSSCGGYPRRRWLPPSSSSTSLSVTGARFPNRRLGLFVFLGDLTYTLYLVHWPVYLALQRAPTGPTGPIGRPSWFARQSSSPLPSEAGSSSRNPSSSGDSVGRVVDAGPMARSRPLVVPDLTRALVPRELLVRPSDDAEIPPVPSSV